MSAKKSDLGVRTLSAVVMLAVAGGALWAGGRVLDGFIVLVSAICFGELVRMVLRASGNFLVRALAIAAGAGYIGYAASLLVSINSLHLLLLLVGSVVCVDVFAYLFGRTLGGPKIAPSISPSKTWAGLLGGVVGATIALVTYFLVGGSGQSMGSMGVELLLPGALIAVVAQTGDFFESWLKRKAGMKDSSNLIPGHGGVFDRIDGLLPVVILVGTVLVQVYPHWLSR